MKPFEVELTLTDKGRIKVKLYLAEAEVERRKEPIFLAKFNVPILDVTMFTMSTMSTPLKPWPQT